MATATVIKGGQVAVMLGDSSSPIQYAAPCGFTQRSITFTKGLEDVSIPDCADPDKVDWLGRDATSLSMAVSGEGVLAVESVEDWFDAWHDVDSVPVKVVVTFPTKVLTWSGRAQVDSIEIGAQNGRTVTANISLQSDGEMVKVVTP